MKKIATFILCMMITAAAGAKEPISLESLLKEMTDRSAVASFPDPAFTCKQASSYDRAAKSPEENWFANGDASQFVREEVNNGRKEWVMMEEEGPGAIVRWWITAPHYRNTIRVYIDGSDTPIIEANSGELLGGEALVGAPLSSPRANGRNLYLPIPYAKSIKVTADKMWTGKPDEEQGNLYYQINFRTYAEGTEVKSFTQEDLVAAKDQIAEVSKKLLLLGSFGKEKYQIEMVTEARKLGPDESFALETISGSRAVTALVVKVETEDVTQALRSLILEISFDEAADDGGQCPKKVCCPVGEFFGSGVGVNPYQSWYTRVKEDGVMVAYWVMPFQKKCDISVKNVGEEAVSVLLVATTKDWNWDDRSMYFHCNWRQQREIPTRPMIDWEYIRLEGKGVFVGDVLSILNRVRDWLGEGDEKIYTDGETFPSHFGTGTEDYYGYAWCTPQFFEAPFHAQPRAEGPGNYGNATNLRFRSLDGIPFTKDFRFDMEVWHWHPTTEIDYAVATMWYGLPGAKAVEAPCCDAVIAEAKMPVSYKSPAFMPQIEGFKFKSIPDGQVSRQTMTQYADKWKNDAQLWWTGTHPGNKMELLVNLEKSGKQKLICGMTKAVDYGVAQFYLDGVKIGEPVDLFNDGVIHTGYVVIGEVDAEAGERKLTVEIIGKNAKSTNYMFGMDDYRFE